MNNSCRNCACDMDQRLERGLWDFYTKSVHDSGQGVGDDADPLFL